MRNVFPRGLSAFFKYTHSLIVVTFIVLLQTSVSLWAADEKSEEITSLKKLIDIALGFNSQNRANSKYLPPENITFLVKKFYYQIETKVEQLATVKEVREHFQEGIEKSKEIFDSGEGDVSQADITKLKLGLSNTLDNIIDLEHDLQTVKLNLGMLINQDLLDGNHIKTTDPLPVKFPYKSFEDYLKADNLSLKEKKIIGTADTSSSEIDAQKFNKLTEENRLQLHKAYLDVESSKAKVILGKNNRKITRALLISEVANYDFGIGDSQQLFEALIIYTRVFSGYLDSVYNFNVTVAKLEKLVDAIHSDN